MISNLPGKHLGEPEKLKRDARRYVNYLLESLGEAKNVLKILRRDPELRDYFAEKTAQIEDINGEVLCLLEKVQGLLE